MILLRCMENIVKESSDRITTDLALILIRLGSDELTQTKVSIEVVTAYERQLKILLCQQDVVPEWQTAASCLLVSLGRKREFGAQVMDSLLTKFPSGAIPHFFVVQTLGTLAAENGT